MIVGNKYTPYLRDVHAMRQRRKRQAQMSQSATLGSMIWTGVLFLLFGIALTFFASI